MFPLPLFLRELGPRELHRGETTIFVVGIRARPAWERTTRFVGICASLAMLMPVFAGALPPPDVGIVVLLPLFYVAVTTRDLYRLARIPDEALPHITLTRGDVTLPEGSGGTTLRLAEVVDVIAQGHELAVRTATEVRAVAVEPRRGAELARRVARRILDARARAASTATTAVPRALARAPRSSVREWLRGLDAIAATRLPPELRVRVAAAVNADVDVATDALEAAEAPKR